MDNKKLFDKYYSRIAREGMLKSAIIGLIVGCSVDIVIGFITLFFAGFGWWFIVALGAGVVVGAVTAFVLYYKLFKPTTKSIAERIDGLGLEERMITMTELENDESFIALRQREDAKQKLGTVQPKNIKFALARSLIIAVSILGVLGLSMTTVNALTGFGVIDWGEIFPPKLTDADFVTVTYYINGEGALEGEDFEGTTYTERVQKGYDSKTIVAVAEDGWAFVGWDDGLYLPERNEKALTEDVTKTAIFEEVGVDGSSEGEIGDGPTDAPREDSDEGDGGKGGGGSDDNTGNTATGSRYEPSNQIIDGETPYVDSFMDDGGWYDQAVKELQENANLTAEQRAMLQSYFESLKAGASSGSSSSGSGDNNEG